LTAREAALKALGEFRRNKKRPLKSLYEQKAKSSISPIDAALAEQIINGVLQNMAYCDYILSCFSTFSIQKIEPRVLDILRISIYQILFLSKIPYSAAVNEGVTLATKSANKKAAGFVNAVLRRIADSAADGSVPSLEIEDICERLSVKYSHPLWLVQKFCEAFGHDGTEALLTSNNDDSSPITAQVNTLLTNTEELIASLAADGITASMHETFDDCVDFRCPGGIERLAAFKKGLFYVQDASSHCAVLAASPCKGDYVIDGCAAPGGKSFAAAVLMRNTGRIEARDISAAKLNAVSEGARRLGIGIIEVLVCDAVGADSNANVAAGGGVAADGVVIATASADGSVAAVQTDSARTGGTVLANASAALADVVLADVPCSGFGVIRKKPEIRYKTREEIAGLPEIQKKILHNLSSYVKPGGTLIYSTCTLLNEENEEVVESFLRERKDFALAGFSLPGFGDVPDGMAKLLPHVHHTDGFFICKMQRKA